MAEAGEAAASSSSSVMPKEKPVVVRVKRKASQMPLDALWLEINERQPKRKILDLTNLSFTGVVDKKKGDSKARRVFVQHVETVESSEAAKGFLELCLENSSDPKGSEKKIGERKSLFKKEKRQELMHSTAIKKHWELARSARFEQIWRSRRSEEKDDDFVSEIYHLYDVMRVDEEEEHENNEESEDDSIQEDAILCNYLPLIREYLPSAAEEIESDMNTRASAPDDYVYDIYTMEGISDPDAQATVHYPMVQVNDEDMHDDDWGSDYETDDSNAENNPRNDYPDEETSEEGDVFQNEEEEYEEEEISGTSDEENEGEKDDEDWRWAYR